MVTIQATMRTISAMEFRRQLGARAMSLPDLGLIGEERAEYRLEPWIRWDQAIHYFAAVRADLRR